MAKLGDKSVGDIIKIKENGVAVNYIIVQKGKPSSMYDSSCDGVWLLREQAHSLMKWDKYSGNSYEDSSVNAWLNGDFLNTIDSKIRTEIKTVKIPYKKGYGGESTPVQSGSSGLSCNIFLLSIYEIGLSTADDEAFPVDGAKLSYFLNGNSDSSAKEKRICKGSSGNNVAWWLRSPLLVYNNNVCFVDETGKCSDRSAGENFYVRPSFVLPSNLSVNSAPTITSDKTGNLGTLAEGFTCNYSVNDVNETDNVTVTISVDSTQIQTFIATKGQQYTYSLTGNDWLKVTNGSHTFKITATDGKETAESTATFTRACSRLSTTLNTPLPANDIIKACSLKVVGAIPDDAVCVYEVTNNAKDSSPAWEDCTEQVQKGLSHAFSNKTAVNGFAFNFRVAIQRGLSNTGGYITKISGGFE